MLISTFAMFPHICQNQGIFNVDLKRPLERKRLRPQSTLCFDHTLALYGYAPDSQ